MTINRISIQAEIDAAYDRGYRNGRLGGTPIPHGYMCYSVLENAFREGYKDGEKARAAAAELKEAAGYYGNTLLTIGSCDDKGGVSIRPIKDHILDDTGTVRKVLVAATNTDRPVYGTAMMLGQTVMVLEPPTRAAAELSKAARELE